jgi:hypothetical protein
VLGRGEGEGVRAVLPLRKSTHGVSASFMVRADDGGDYWCKAVNNPASPRIPTNEQIAARLGAMIGVSVTTPVLVNLDGLTGWEFHPGRRVEPGWAHGGTAVEGAFELRTLDHRGDDDNRVRHAGFYALVDWLAGGDQQWLYSAPAQNAYYSHDHGHYFPGGPDWTPAALAAMGTNACQLSIPPSGLDRGELQRLAGAIEAVTRQEIDAVLAKIPSGWPVSDGELDRLGAFLDARRGPAAARLRALVA